MAKKEANRPFYLEYKKPCGRERRRCCYKDNPCKTHATVLNQLVRMAYGEVEPTPNNLLSSDEN
jgi:hypothetical protein